MNNNLLKSSLNVQVLFFFLSNLRCNPSPLSKGSGMGLLRAFLLLFFITPQVFAHTGHGDHRTLSATVVTGGIDVTLSGAQLGFELYGCSYPTGGTACTYSTTGADDRLSGWVNNSTNTFEHRSLNAGTIYLYKAVEYESSGTHQTNEASATTPNAPALTASSISETAATLTLTNHSGNWYYKETAPTSGSCSAAQTSASVNLTNLTAGTSYTYSAYSDSACSTELASETFNTLMSLNLTATPAQGKVDLSWTQISGAVGYDLYYCEGASCTVPTSGATNPPYLGWQAGETTTTYEHTGLSASTTYRYQVTHYVGGTVRSNVAEAMTPDTPALTASNISETAATLTLTNHSGDWYYKETAPTSGSCSAAQTSTSVNLTNLTAGTSYTYSAYSDNTCSTELASEMFTTLTPAALTASSISETAATLTLTNHSGNWYYKETAPTSGSCSAAQTSASVNLTNLTAGTSYTYSAYLDSACSTELASETFNTLMSLNLTATPAQGKVDLSWTQISGAVGYDLYYCEGASCTVPTSGATNPPYLGWQAGETTTTYEHTDLSASTTYRYQVTHYVGGTVRSNVAEAATPNASALAASNISATAATLTLTNHSGNWYYKETAPSSGSCSAAQTGTSVNLTNLTAGTSYTYSAYSDNTCSTELASATFTTLYDLNLRVTASNASAITLSWPNLSTVTTGYDVYRCTVESQCAANPPTGANAIYLSWVPKPGGDTITLIDDNGTESGGSPSPINPGTTYYYAVQGYISGGDTGFSRVTATAGAPRKSKPAKPAKPVGLIVTSVSAEAISLRWKPSSGSEEGTGYGVYRCTVPEGKSTCEPYDDLWLAYLDNSNTYTDTEVTPGETYRYQVAPDNLQRENLSRAVTVTVGAQMSEMVTSPTGLTVTETTESLVRLSWTAPEDDGKGPIQAIDIYRCNVDRSPDCSEFLHLTSRNPALTKFRDNDVEPDTTYRYAIASYRLAKEVSPWSNQVTATTKRGRYASPTGLTVTATFRNAISLSWTAPAEGILGYNIYRCLVPSGASSCNTIWHAWVANEGDAPPAPTSYTDTGGETGGITRNLTYLYVVAASYPPSYRNGDRSEPVVGTARGGTFRSEPEPEPSMIPPASPTGFMAVSGASGIDLSWAAPSDDIVGYSIYRCEEGETSCTPEWIVWVANEGDAPPAPTSYVDADVTSGTIYRYAVTSNNVDSDGEYHESDWSDEVTVVAREGSPGAPTNLTAVPGAGQITLSWTPPLGTVTGWELLVRTETDTGSWMSITPSGTTTKSYTVTDLTNGVQYTFLVRAVNGTLKGAPAGRRGATTVPSLNTGEFEASFGIRVSMVPKRCITRFIREYHMEQHRLERRTYPATYPGK